MERTRPAYAVFFKTRLSWLAHKEKSQDFFRWIDSYLREHYELAAVFVKEDFKTSMDFKMIIREGIGGLPDEVMKKSYIWIYRRKGHG